MQLRVGRLEGGSVDCQIVTRPLVLAWSICTSSTHFKIQMVSLNHPKAAPGLITQGLRVPVFQGCEELLLLRLECFAGRSGVCEIGGLHRKPGAGVNSRDLVRAPGVERAGLAVVFKSSCKEEIGRLRK